MRLIRGRIKPGAAPLGCVVTIGKFDGVHQGHGALLDAGAREASRLGRSLIVLTFEPYPEEFFGFSSARLTPLRTKWRLLEQRGRVDWLVCLRFDQDLADQSASTFVRQVLVEGLGVRTVVVGEDFRFGRKRLGDVDFLRRMAKESGFGVKVVPPVSINGDRVSSSRVRSALIRHQLEQAATLLGRYYCLYGTVVEGDHLGRRLGFPTVNLSLGRHVPPLGGVYVVRAWNKGKFSRFGLANVGVRPTLGYGGRRLLEVYFPEWEGNLYGQMLGVEFRAWIREERQFADLCSLKDAMEADQQAGTLWLSQRGLQWNGS